MLFTMEPHRGKCCRWHRRSVQMGAKSGQTLGYPRQASGSCVRPKRWPTPGQTPQPSRRTNNEPDGVLEGAGQAPLARPPRGARALRDRGRILGGRADPEELHRVDDVDGVGDVDEDEADGLTCV